MNTNDENDALLKIFLEEAKDLLDAISATLQVWAKDLNNKSCFSDLKRDLHTLKGGARMVNQPELSSLAHETESFCESLLAGSIAADRQAYEKVCANQDQMVHILEALSPTTRAPSTIDAIKPEKPESGSDTTSNVIRIRSDLLEKLNNLSIESNITRVNMGHYVDNFNTHIGEISRLAKSLQEKCRLIPKEVDLHVTSEILGLINLNKNLAQVHGNIDALLSQQSRVEMELQDRLVDTRMVPFSSVVPRLSRITRQIAAELNKKVDFTVLEVEGEIDRTVLEHIVPSLEHLLRNALDHGIELPTERLLVHKPEIGNIQLRFFRMGNEACIEISDNGAGIDPEVIYKKAIKLGLVSAETQLSADEKIHYIMEPGFSTSEVISEISGRGVGMDVVNTVVKGLGGNLAIDSKPGQGTKFTIRLPFTMSINRALLVVVQGQNYGILLSSIENIILLNVEEIKEALNLAEPVIMHNDKTYPLKYLGDALNIEEKSIFSDGQERLPVLLFNFLDFNAAVLVDSLAGSQEIVVQALGPQFKLTDIFSGGTLLSGGSVVIILDVYAIVTRAIKHTNEKAEMPATTKKPAVVLVVDDSVTIRTVTKNFLERHKFTVITAKDGLDALEKLEQTHPNIILLDVEMPRMNGFQFAEKIRSDAQYADIPIVMITFCVGDEQRKLAEALGIKKFMGKPYQELELLETINALLGEK
jgi:chemosensory pili system protein ChpA (sensor histidine kinase/response regulator)